MRGKVEQMNATKPKLVVIEKEETVAPEPERKRGAAKMREAADEIVGRDCKSVVEALSVNWMKGQTLSAKLLYGLAQLTEASGEGDGARKIRSIATEWANSPEWNDDLEAETQPDEKFAGN
jgi:hypothetical protein